MGARGNNMFNLGELGGVFRTEVWERGVPLLDIPPTTMKSVIALNGRAEKHEIITALRARFGLHIPHHDEADAVGLMLLCEMYLGQWRMQYDELDAKRKKSLSACEVHAGKLKSISERIN